MNPLRSDTRALEFFSPGTVAEAVQILSEVTEPVTILAGGTDLMVQIEQGRRAPSGIILDLSRLGELQRIGVEGERVRIGAMATCTDIGRSDVLRAEALMLVSAARTVGSPQIQNRATIGGNIMNASPAADLLPPLLALGAHVVLASNEGRRAVPLFSFFAGYRQPVAKASELLVEVVFQRAPEARVDYFRKVGPRRASSIAKVALAGRAFEVARPGGGLAGGYRLGIASVAPICTRLFETERFLSGRTLDAKAVEEAVRILQTEISPRDDLRSSAAYRRFVAGNMLREFLRGV